MPKTESDEQTRDAYFEWEKRHGKPVRVSDQYSASTCTIWNCPVCRGSFYWFFHKWTGYEIVGPDEKHEPRT